jgi:hypothetical protein
MVTNKVAVITQTVTLLFISKGLALFVVIIKTYRAYHNHVSAHTSKHPATWSLTPILMFLSEEQRRKFDRIYQGHVSADRLVDAYDLCERTLRDKFPIKIRYLDNNEIVHVDSPMDIASRRTFICLEIRCQPPAT